MTFKDRFISGNSLGAVQLEVGLEYHKTIDYDRRAMRKALVGGAGIVRKEARRLLSRRAVSKAGEAPGRDSGDLVRAIGVVSRGSKGGWIKIAPRSIKGSVFYPAFLFYGTDTIAPRDNFMATALVNKREPVRNLVRGALQQSLVPR